MTRIDDAVARGIAYLESTQAVDGSFMTYTSTSRTFRTAHPLPTTFGSALILGALGGVANSEAIRERIAQWLLGQKNADWSFNYWTKGAAERTTRPYPNDLDDTCCALIGLYLHNPALVDAPCLANVVRLLVAAEYEVGGPYKTWLAPKTSPIAWHDVDLVVNANVAYLLELVAEPLPKLQALMGKAILSGNLTSPYYPLPLVVMYFIARAYHGEGVGQLAANILGMQAYGHWKTPAQTALAVSALRYTGHAVPAEAIVFLTDKQQSDGSWPAEPLWLDKSDKNKAAYAGSAALTTALVIEALAKTSKNIEKPVTQKCPSSSVLIVRKAGNCVQSLGQPLRSEMLIVITRMSHCQSIQEIVLLPQLFASALRQTPHLAQSFYEELGLANLFGWIAYTIYDDFLDAEGNAQKLGVANVSMRKSLHSFAAAQPNNSAFQQRVADAFNRIDNANTWEVSCCRFETDGKTVYVSGLPTFRTTSFLGERSVGHVLAPLGVLAAAGLALDDPRVALFEKGFCHYLAARQLNDDLHDWRQDFAKGRITYVVAHLLREIGAKPGRQSYARLQAQLEKQFWQHSLGKLCSKVMRQIQLSRQAYKRSQLFVPNNPFDELLVKLEATMQHTMAEQQKALQFLKAFRKPT
ncbi:MAG TPA: prenyltransferase/squalene oxidase repeat-containing protein [Candidatus Saccharimonadales bacterium]|nr:prenyltransferase/squalene oxidase repeat-containing protein [Candidatus Saccharimonadales bacterium]